MLEASALRLSQEQQSQLVLRRLALLQGAPGAAQDAPGAAQEAARSPQEDPRSQYGPKGHHLPTSLLAN